MIHSPVISMLMVAIMLIPLLDAFDRIFAQTTIRLDGSDGTVLLPINRWIAWGIISNVRLPGQVHIPRDVRFFHVYLPFRTWGLTSHPGGDPYSATYGLRAHRLQWIERCQSDNSYLGWHLVPRLES